MDTFWNRILSASRIIAVAGHFGSGKTEFCVSLAFALRKRTGERLAVADLDIENPYFRSRERQAALDTVGIAVYSDPFNGKNASELQVISASVRAPLEDPGCRVLLDCGGGVSGVRILNQFGKYFQPGTYQLLGVVNPYRPGSSTVEQAAADIRAMERATGLSFTGLVANGHLIRETTLDEVRRGWAFTRALSDVTGIPALCVCCMERLAPDAEDLGFPVFPIGMYLRDSYLDRPV